MSPSFDPFTQSFALLYADGTPFNVSIPELDWFVRYNTKICINYASQLGGSIVLLVVLALLTKPEKRYSPIFFLNATALLLNVVRLICMCLYFTGAWSESYAYLAEDYSRVHRSDYSNSVAGVIFTFLLLVCIELSLVLQTQIICVTLNSICRALILIFSTVIALVTIGFKFATAILSAKYILSASSFARWVWLQSASNIVVTISVCFFSTVFAVKLGIAIFHRRKMGLKQFGPMQAIFITSTQTMIVPGRYMVAFLTKCKSSHTSAIFSIMQYVSSIPEMESNVLTLVAIFLPLSSIWAAASIRSQQPEPTYGSQKSMLKRHAMDSVVSTAAESSREHIPLSDRSSRERAKSRSLNID